MKTVTDQYKTEHDAGLRCPARSQAPLWPFVSVYTSHFHRGRGHWRRSTANIADGEQNPSPIGQRSGIAFINCMLVFCVVVDRSFPGDVHVKCVHCATNTPAWEQFCVAVVRPRVSQQSQNGYI